MHVNFGQQYLLRKKAVVRFFGLLFIVQTIAAAFADDSPLVESLWAYQENLDLDPPKIRVFFCVRADLEEGADRQLWILSSVGFSKKNIGKVFFGKLGEDDPGVFYRGTAPQRDVAFHRLDIDQDGTDEVLMTGRGGAGGTSLLSVFQINRDGARLLYSGASRFGFTVFDEDGDHEFDLANPGFEWQADANSILREKEFRIYQLRNGKFEISKRMTPENLRKRLEALNERKGVPLLGNKKAADLRIYDDE